MMQILLPLFVLLLASSQHVVVVNAGKYVLSIEPYIGEWCSVQFPQATGLLEATNGLGMASMLKDRSYKLLEPYAAQYCFDVFGHDQLKNLDAEDIQQQLSKRGTQHGSIQIEPYLMEWGQKAILSPGSGGGGGGLAVPDVNQFIIEWCVKGQFWNEIKAAKGGVQQALEDSGRYRTTAKPIELDLAPWCWEQFPIEMKDLNQQSALAELADSSSSHGTSTIVKIEPYLMKWEIANFHVRNHPDIEESSSPSASSSSTKTSWSGFFFKFVLFIGGCVLGIGYLQKNHPHITEAAHDRIQHFIQQRQRGGYQLFGSGSSFNPSGVGTAPMMMMPPYDPQEVSMSNDMDYRGVL